MTDSTDILQKILAYKQAFVADRKATTSLEQLKSHIACSTVPRDFVSALKAKLQSQKPAVIAEVKKASPSKGVIRDDFYPDKIAVDYAAHGAACLSVLTDEKFFQGSDSYLQHAKANSDLPLLRKDFIIDPYQVYEARAIGADAILLIVAALDDQALTELHDLALSLNLAVLVEVHDTVELQRAITLRTPLIGINNRNLRNFKTDLQTTINLLPLIPDEKIVITESGINRRADIEYMQNNGVYAFLIGETLMREASPGKKLAELLGQTI